MCQNNNYSASLENLLEKEMPEILKTTLIGILERLLPFSLQLFWTQDFLEPFKKKSREKLQILNPDDESLTSSL